MRQGQQWLLLHSPRSVLDHLTDQQTGQRA